jgi:hypothetical protein
VQIYCAENQHNKIIYSNLLKINLVVWFWVVSLHHQINEIMKQLFILIEKSELKNLESVNSFYDRKEMMQYQADNLNEDLASSSLVWVLQPNN